jgi:hypothetical protein
MSSFKRVNPADQFQDTIIANKRWTGTYSSYPYSDDYIKVYTGQNIPGPFNISSLQSQSVYYKSEYDKINHLFYQDYTTGLNTQQRTVYSLNYESASATRATASSFVYNENPLFYTEFSVNPNDTIKTIYISQSIYGNSILPGSTIISSSDYYILDDGNGNLFDFKYVLSGINLRYVSASYVDYNYVKEYIASSGSGYFVGNMFYSFGLAVITDQLYQKYFPISASNPLSISFQNEYPVYENYIYCKTKAGEFNLTYNPTLTPGTGSQIYDFATGSLASGSYFTPYATSIGLYNDNNELLMIAKLGQPIPISATTDMTFIIRYDT